MISSSLNAAGFLAEAERSEAAVLLVAAGAAGDLRHFGDRQPAVAAAVELLEAGEGDMGDVHVEAHADGVGGDEIIDLAALEHRDLGVAGGGDSAPITTAAPPLKRRSISASA